MTGLEHSCGPEGTDWIRVAPSDPSVGLNRIEARFAGHAYDPHRHDTYAIGITRRGVQSFRYRGALRHSLAGDVIVLHPDEVHDGHAGDAAGFHYHMLYIDPAPVLEALGENGGNLPFVEGGISRDGALREAVSRAFDDLDAPLEPLETLDLLADIAVALRRVTRTAPRRPGRAVDTAGVGRAKDAMLAHIADGISLEELEAITGQSRFALARHFRAQCGVNPHRWLTARRLERVWERIVEGGALAEAAVDAGFADQSHMTRHFRRAFGLPPGAWRKAVLQGRSERSV